MSAIYYYQLDRPERAMAGLYPLLMLMYGYLVGAPFLLMLIAIKAFILFRLGSYYEFGYLIGGELIIVPGGLFSYFFYGNAITKLGRVSCVILTIMFGLLLLWMVRFNIAQVLRPVDTASQIIDTITLGALMWMFGSIMSGWFRLARATDQDRFLLRAPFNGMVNRMAVQFFCGLPPIINFVKGAKSRFLFLASSLLFAVAFSISSGLLLEMRGEDDRNYKLIILAAIFIIVPLSIIAANLLLNSAQKAIRFSIEGITAADSRPPLLFLRAFRDDQVNLAAPRYMSLGRLFAMAMPRQSLDHMLLTEGTLYGPMVALGNPRDAMPPYGVARGYFANEYWQSAVMQLARSSLAVVICVDDTDAMWWEIEHLVARDYLKKTLFLIHPKFRDRTENLRIIGRLLPKLTIADRLQRQVCDAFQTADVIGFFFEPDGSLYVGKSRFFTFFSYLLVTRWFLRRQFGLPLSSRAGRPLTAASK
jgi:hypothetical protein